MWLFAFFCVTAMSSSIGAQVTSQYAGHPVASVLQIDANAPVVDGRLDEGVWARAQPVTDFFQRELVEGDPVSERTEVRIVADEEALYIGAWLYDRTPDQVVVGERVGDANLETGDYFGIILDTYRDRQNGFIFSTTPASIEYAGQVVREGQGGGVFSGGRRANRPAPQAASTSTGTGAGGSLPHRMVRVGTRSSASRFQHFVMPAGRCRRGA